jgi:hypothetical protein
LIKEVKEENPKTEPIESPPSPPTKQEAESRNSIESKPKEDSIEKSIEKPKEETKPEEKQEEKTKESEKKPSKPETKKKGGKFTTIMLTKELKEKLEKGKDPHESYGDYIKRLLEK